MSLASLTKFNGGTQDKGLNVFEPKIGTDINWSSDTVNISGGIRRGAGPRYGMAPLPGHSNTINPSGNELNGLQRSEGTGGNGLIHRRLVFASIPMTMAQFDGTPGTYPETPIQFYLWLVGLDYSTSYSVDACLSAVSSGGMIPSPYLRAGLEDSSYREESPLIRQHKTELLNLPQNATPTAADMQSLLKQIDSRYWLPYAHISVSGKRVPYHWLLGYTGFSATPDATHAPDVGIWNIPLTSGASPTANGGSPSEAVTQDYVDNNSRKIQVYTMDANGYYLDAQYNLTIDNTNVVGYTRYSNSATYNIHGVTASKVGASTAYTSMKVALVNDPGSFTNTRHDAILLATDKPIAVVYQDWLLAADGMFPRWVDLSSPTCNPRNSLSFNEIGQQNSSFVNGSAPFGTGPGADTGILMADTTYEFGFSMYNKLLDYETNVSYSATFTPTVANSGVLVAITSGTVQNLFKKMQTGVGAQLSVPWDFSNTVSQTGGEVPRGFHINDYEYRFYYREAGTSEWLPAGNYDASQLWFYWNWPSSYGGSTDTGAIICSGPVGGLPGGQPNGFVDYSPLPKQTYICTTVFQNRAFWWSAKSMHFSLANNIYAYSTRNIVATPTGKWRGGIVHSQKDLSQQVSRLVVFGDQTFAARFTGEKTLQSVRISADTVGQFEIDGSDFRMDYLCDATAFSFRSAVVADGVLFFWGPQGFYRDDGNSKPEKISIILEPDVFNYVDTTRDTEVHCIYNKRSKEVIWFYPPKVADTTYPTYGLVLNIENGNFYPFKMPCQVDASQNIKIENDLTSQNISGERILLHCRSDPGDNVSRTFFFDDLVQAGDQYPYKELTISTVATPATGTRRFTFASGSIGVTAGNIEVGDYISVQNAKGWATSLTLANDFVAKITAVNNGSSYIDIELPVGAIFDASGTFNSQTSFPIWQRKPAAAGLHGITYLLDTNYWLPTSATDVTTSATPERGMSEAWNWVYLYFLYRYLGIPSPTNPFTGKSATAVMNLAYRTLVSGAAATDVLTLINNSADQCQIHHPLRNVERSANGQALKYSLSGIHIGDPWTLEYLEAHCIKEKGFTLKEFEG